MFKDMTWMAWVLAVGIVEAIIRFFNNDIYLFIEEDEWEVTYFNRKKK